MAKKKKPTDHVFLESFQSVHRLLLCFGIAVIVAIGLILLEVDSTLCIIISWNCFSILMIAISWITFFTTSSNQLFAQARKQDESQSMTFVIVLVSVCVSLFGAIALIVNGGDSSLSKGVHVAVTILTIMSSWILLHTIYTLRYAHLYYTASLSAAAVEPSGLDFPKLKDPDYLDFAYFSFVIGMTFQVSDVSVTSPLIRRFVLLHGLISFVFNTIIVALTINILASIGK